jgi:hypothetical protein
MFTLQDASQVWQKLGQEIGSTGKSYVQTAISGILENRESAAAQASVSAVGAMVPWMDNVTQVAAKAAQRAQEQADYWVTAKNSVPPVPPAPKSTGFFSDPGEWAAEKMDWFPGVTSEEEKAQKRQQDAAEQARQAMRVYQDSSNPNIDAAPAFTAPQALDGSVGSLPLTSTSTGAPSTAPAMAGAGGPAHVMAAHQPATHQAAAQPAAYQQGGTPPTATVSRQADGQATRHPMMAWPLARWYLALGSAAATQRGRRALVVGWEEPDSPVPAGPVEQTTPGSVHGPARSSAHGPPQVPPCLSTR